MSKGRILLVSFHFYPSPEVGAKRPSETALHLKRIGYEVTVLRAWERQFAGLPVPAGFAELHIVSITVPRRMFTALWIALKRALRITPNAPAANRAGAPAAQNRSAPGRLGPLGWLRRQALAYDTLFQGNKRWLLCSVVRLWLNTRRRRYDLVIASGPPMVSYICGWLASHFAGRKLLLDFRDPWYLHGDKELTTVMLNHPLAKFENGLGKTCVQRSSAIVAASPGTKRHIVESFGVPPDSVQVVRNGFDEHALVGEAPPRGRLELLYTGSLYWNRNPFPFLEALHALSCRSAVDASKVRLRLVGKCERWKDTPLRPWLAERRMETIVEILPYVRPQDLRAIVASSNVLINFAQGQPRQIPAKSYDYLAAGREVLVLAETESDVADLFREAGIGHVVEPDDAAGMARVLEDLYARYVRGEGAKTSPAPAVARYSRAAQLEAFSGIVAKVLADA
jgi:glycosyltransferase involved in cell wall biosynthesis